MSLSGELVRSYARVLFRPREFFSEWPSPTATEGAIAVFVVSLMTTLSILAIGAILADLFGSEGYPDAASAIWGVIGRFVVIGIVGLFVVWIVTGAVMHLVVTFSTGGGSYVETLGVTGYGMLPVILQTILGVGFVYMSLRNVHLSGGPEAVAAQLQRVFQGGGPIRELTNWAFIAWQVAIWTFGLERVHDVSRGRAVLAASIVGVALGLFG